MIIRLIIYSFVYDTGKLEWTFEISIDHMQKFINIVVLDTFQHAKIYRYSGVGHLYPYL